MHVHYRSATILDVAAILFLLRHLDQFRWRFWLLVAFGIIDGIVIFSVPLLIASVLKSTPLDRDVDRTIALVTLGILTSIALEFWLRKSGESLASELSNHLRVKLFSALESLPLQSLTRHHSGYLLSITNQLADGIGGLGSVIVWLVGHAGAILVLFFVYTAQQSIPIAIFNFIFLVLFLWVSARLSRAISALSLSENETRARMTERFADSMANIITVKRLHVHDFILSTITRTTSEHDSSIKALQTFHARRWAILHLLFYSSYVVTIYMLLRGIAHGWVVGSMMVLFVASFSQVRQYLERLSELIKRCMELNAFIFSSEKVLADASANGRSNARQEWSSLLCDAVQYRYQPEGPTILIPSFRLSKGDIVVVTGESGQGKSSLLSILSGMLPTHVGACYLDEIPYNGSHNPSSLIALVSQETELFDLSVRDNLLLGSSHTDQALLEILRELGLGSWIEQLPAGLSTRVGEKGITVSSGQKQRLTIARALLMSRPIIFLDEPTSHLDPATERIVVECLTRHLRTKTAIIVSHGDAFRGIATRRARFQNHSLQEIAT